MSARFPTLATLALTTLALTTLVAKEKNPSPGRAENAAVIVTAEAFTERDAIKGLVGSDLNGYYTVLRVTVTPKSGKLAIQHDDFLLRTDKDGERTHPMEASQIAGRTDMTVAAVSTGTVGTEKNSPVWSGIPGMGTSMPSNGGFGGNGAGGSTAVGKMNKDESAKVDPMYKILKEKILVEKETDQPAAGLLFFNLEKQKLKDLELIYTTSEGPLKLRFK
jgi:hypothetical protein